MPISSFCADMREKMDKGQSYTFSPGKSIEFVVNLQAAM